MAAIAVRADRLMLITPYQSKMFWIEMSKLGYRKREPSEPPKGRPKPASANRSPSTCGKLGCSVLGMADCWPEVT